MPGRLGTRGPYQRAVLGTAATLAGLLVLLALLLPFRTHLSTAIPALTFVVLNTAAVVAFANFITGRKAVWT